MTEPRIGANGFAVRAAAILPLCAALLLAGPCGCATSNPKGGNTMAFVEITGHTAVDIYHTAEEVFRAQGYEKSTGFSFERKGSTMDTLSHGGWYGPVWLRVKLTLDPHGTDMYCLGGDIYYVLDRGDLVEEQKKASGRRRDCQRLLDEVKQRLEKSGTPPGY